MKRLYLIIVFIFIISQFFFSCYYDNEEALYPEICDTTNITFTTSDPAKIEKTVSHILEVNCYACHSNVNSVTNTNGKNIRLQDYTDVVARASQISQAMNHTGPSSIIPMPYNGGKIQECSIKRFDAWVLRGMPNN